IATVGGSNGGAGGSSVTISGNGAFSDNDVALTQASAVVLDQSNNAHPDHTVTPKAQTGDNTETSNTGGNNGLKTGDATTNVGVNFDLSGLLSFLQLG